MRAPSFRAILVAAPVIFAAHVLEEAPGFVTWVNERIDRDITQSSFWAVNIVALIITLAVVLFEWTRQSKSSAIAAVVWLGFLMYGNALIHIAASVVDRGYVPGVVTALMLYLPFIVLVVTGLKRSGRVPPPVIALSLVLGSLPMLLHGYMIHFRGTRLF